MNSDNKNITYKISFTTTGASLCDAQAQVKRTYRNEEDAIAMARHLMATGLVVEVEVSKVECVFWKNASEFQTPKIAS